MIKSANHSSVETVGENRSAQLKSEKPQFSIQDARVYQAFNAQTGNGLVDEDVMEDQIYVLPKKFMAYLHVYIYKSNHPHQLK